MTDSRRAVAPRLLAAALAGLLAASLLATQPAAAQDSPQPADPPARQPAPDTPGSPKNPAAAPDSSAAPDPSASAKQSTAPASSSTQGICGRTPAVQTAILAKISGITNCAAVTPTHLSALAGALNLSNKGLTTLRDGDFDNLTNLATLNVSNNQLTTLPDLNNLTNLTQLYISGNRLTTLPDLNNLTNFTHLSADRNQLTTLPNLDNLTKLTSLRTSGNQLTTLPNLDNLTNLTTLSVFDNQLKTLPDLDNLTNLIYLSAGRNQLTTLPNLDNLTNLRGLYISGNRLTTLPNLDNLTNLTELWAAGNLLTTLPNLDNLTNLTQLLASTNRLTALPSLDSLTNLTKLWASGNQLSSLPDLDNLTNLTQLVVSSNRLTALPDLSTNTGLRWLHLSHGMGRDGTPAVPDGFVENLPASLNRLEMRGFEFDVDDIVSMKTRLTNLTTRALDPAVVVSGHNLAVTEGSTAQYRVVLATAPRAAVTVTPAVEDGAAVAVLPETLTFTDWGVPQTFTVTAAQDTDGDDESVAVSHSASGDSSYAGRGIATVQVGVHDDDAAALSALVLAGSDGNEIALAPDFAADERSYTASVGHGTTSMTVTATAASSAAALRAGKHGGTLAAIDSGTASGAIELTVGDNAIDIEVAAQRGTSGTYTVTVTRAAPGTSGVCGRTPAVRDAIVALVTAASGCSAVTGAHLAAATGTLDISGQELTELNDGDFDGLGGLTGLDVSDNQLAALPRLGDLSGLTTLDAHSNLLTTLPSLNRLRGLTALDVSDNRLQRLPSLNRLSGLTNLDASTNRLTALPSLNSLNGLTTLDASTNRLQRLPSLDNLTALTGLNVHTNRLAALPSLDNLTALTTLNVHTNRLAALPSLDNLTALTGLNVHTNRLAALPSLDNLTALTGLNVHTNRLAALPSLRRVRALATLDVSGNLLEGLPDLSRLSALTTLDASRNRLKSLPGLGRLRALTGLDVSRNRLKKLPSLARLAALTGLDVSRNRLKAPPDVSSLSALSSLDIGHNNATTLPEAYLDGIPAALESLGLHGFELTVDEIVTAKTRLTALSELSADTAVALSTTELDVTEGQSVQYRLVLAAPPESAVTVTVASSDAAVAVSPTPLTFTDWGEPATLTVSAAERGGGTEAVISHSATGDSAYTAATVASVTVSVHAAPGVCGRTAAVRDAIMARAGESDCATVTDAHLAAITGVLNLPGRGLTALKDGDFDGLSGLATLNVSNNGLTALPDLDELTSLRTLNAAGNSLTALPDLDGLSGLATLNVSNNGLTTLPDLDELASLRTLNVSNNSLTALPDLDALTSLTGLYVSNNALSELPGLAALRSLSVLSVANNQLEALPDLGGLSRLQSLHAHDNQLEALPDLSANTALEQFVVRRTGPATAPEGYADTLPASLNGSNAILRLFGFRFSAADLVTLKTRFTRAAVLGLDPAVAVSGTDIGVLEGGRIQYQVVLATRPSTAVAITATSSSPAAAVTPETLTFTDWGVAQTFTVAAPQDSDADDAAATIAHRATGDAVYAAIAIDTARVAVTDDDSTLGSLALTGSDTRPVALSPAFAPRTLAYTAAVAHTTTAVTVTAKIADPSSQAAVTVAQRGDTPAPATPGTPSGPVSLEVGANIIDVTVAAGTTSARTYTVTVTRAEPEPTTVTLSASSTNPAEGATTTVTAALDGAATSPVTLVLTAAGTAGPDDYTLSATTITIAAGERHGTAVITVADDSIDDDDETIVIKLTSTSLTLSSTDVLTVTIADNDSAPSAPPVPALTGGDAKITATWTAPGAGLLNASPTPTTGYQIRYRPSGGEWSVPIAAVGVTATIVGLVNDTAHQVQVRALNIAGAGPWSPAAAATPAATPGTPTGLAATARLADGKTLTLNLAWSPPAGTVTGYRIQYKQRTATHWADWPHTGTAGTATIAPAAPLAGATTYDVRVAALNQQTPGPYTTTSATTPPAPTN